MKPAGMVLHAEVRIVLHLENRLGSEFVTVM